MSWTPWQTTQLADSAFPAASCLPCTLAEALKDLEESLRALGTDYIDLWLLHDRSRASELTPDLIEAQQLAKKQGKVRFVGVSTHRGQAQIVPAMIKSGKFDAVMLTYNFAMDTAEVEPLIQLARDAGLGVIAMKVLAGSFRLDPAMYERGRAVMRRTGAGLAALKWVLRNKNVDVAIPSMVDMSQLEENIRAMSEPFDGPDDKLLEAYLDRFGPRYCRMCGRCEGTCSKGLPVADLMRFLTYAEGYGRFPLARERFLQLPAETRKIRCTCPSCTHEYVFGVRVAEHVRRAQKLFV